MRSLLEVRDLNVTFDTFDGAAHALRHIDFDVEANQAVGLVGETGSGKTVLSLAVLGLVPVPGRVEAAGITFSGHDLLRASRRETVARRGGDIARIPQNPMNALNPVFRIEKLLCDVIRRHSPQPKRQARKGAQKLLGWVGLPDPEVVLKKRSYELSGGMCQRVAIAMALSANPSLLIADEPTTALDVTVQQQIIRLINALRVQFGSSLVWISHDLGVIKQTCERVHVMYTGTIVEIGSTEDVFSDPLHPYTAALIDAIPSRRKRGGDLREIRGRVPSLLSIPAGCVFHPRCEHAVEVCRGGNPPRLESWAEGRYVACHRPDWRAR